MISGVGIHTGSRCEVRLHRSEGPLRFRHGSVEVEALLPNVVSTERCIALGKGAARVATVEHLLAALQLSGFWHGVVAEVSGEELPILDGSALPWREEIATLGEPPELPAPLVPEEPVRLETAGGCALVEPGERRLDVSIAYEHPAIGVQRWQGEGDEWSELLDARTFGFESEIESLNAAGLALGAGMENAIVFDDSRPLCPLRHTDEPVRHKALDLVGDMTLLGRPLQAAIRISRGSHRLHVELMRQLASSQLPPEQRQ